MEKACLLCVFAIALMAGHSQEKVSIQVDAQKTSGIIDELLYGQLFEHIYFSANNGVWQELIFERSFEPTNEGRQAREDTHRHTQATEATEATDGQPNGMNLAECVIYQTGREMRLN